MPNRLAQETSPYLLQHRDNPVDWWAWNAESLELARSEDKPIFLSIGYSACHWCHVMEHESFENEAIAALLNEHFVSIKVDREERPDLDQIYMNAVQTMTGRGGWPMSLFLTPALEPFYGGTYWPPVASRGMPGFDQILQAVHQAWTDRRDEVLKTSSQMTEHLRQQSRVGGARREDALVEDTLHQAVRQLERLFDPNWGGFGQAPKFPHPMDLRLLLRMHHREHRGAWLDIVRLSLDRMAAGGIYDHLGGGFSRYSVDERWLVPHFEKMLYDNAQLAVVYLEAYLVNGVEANADVVRGTLDYVLRDMTHPEGGFCSAEDADSEGEEGRFYTWTPAEVREVLGDVAAGVFCRVYDVTEEGNFEGRSILNLRRSIAKHAVILERAPEDLARELASSREKLFAAREKRVRPGRDDKVIVAWNGLMIEAMARAGALLGEPRYLQAARNAADFILREMRGEDGRLLHTWRGGQAKLDAYLDDYGCLANALVTLYETTFEEIFIDAAAELLEIVQKRFADPEGGAFFYTADDQQQQLITRNVELTDNATPGGASMVATALLRLGKLTGDSRHTDAGVGVLEAAGGLMEKAPTATGQMLLALDFHLGPTPELVFVGDDAESQQTALAVHSRYFPRRTVAYRRTDAQEGQCSRLLDAAFAGKETSDSAVALYVCENHACQAAAFGPVEVAESLDRANGV